jgi:predicted HTH transcriptional regulator
LNIESFKEVFKDKTGEVFDHQALRKLELVKISQEIEYPTQALVLFSDDALRNALFHYAKVECARFKGTQSEEFIDQKSIYSNIATQAEEAYNFVLRHINKGATVEGVYTVSRWEYPIKAVREVIRNAVVHRDYSLTGKDIKVAIYDDMIEITSPGLLPPSIDYSAMGNRQSDARNKIIAPVFKHLGIIDQWGNGLTLIKEELKEYPQIDFRWKDVGLSFQIQFVNLNYVEGQELQQELQNKTLYSDVLVIISVEALSRNKISKKLGQKTISGQLNKVLLKLIENKLIEYTIPDNPTHPAQKFRLSERGKTFLQLLKDK